MLDRITTYGADRPVAVRHREKKAARNRLSSILTISKRQRGLGRSELSVITVQQGARVAGLTSQEFRAGPDEEEESDENDKEVRRCRAFLPLTAALALAGCGGGDIEDSNAGSGGADCGELNMAINPWVGYEADAHVVGRVAETELGCTVNYKDLDEQISWKGFGTGEVDVVIENWGHPELQAKYMESEGGDGTATDFGPTGNDGVIGWYVPPWMAEEYPDITDWENLNKYSDLFKTSESGDKGTLSTATPASSPTTRRW